MEKWSLKKYLSKPPDEDVGLQDIHEVIYPHDKITNEQEVYWVVVLVVSDRATTKREATYEVPFPQLKLPRSF